MNEFSPSRLEAFERCPGAFKLHYLDGIEEDDNGPARIGRDVHLLAEAQLRGGVDPPVTPSQETLDIYQTFKNNFYPAINPKNILSVEERVEVALGDYILVVKMDLLMEEGGFLFGVDLKTTNRLMTTEEMKKSIQVRAYCVAMMKLYPSYNEGVFQIWNLRLNQKQTLEFTRKETELWAASLEDDMTLVAARVRAYEKGKKDALPFLPGAPCEYCGYKKACPAFKSASTAVVKKLPKNPLSNAKSAATMATRVVFALAYAKLGKALLKTWIEKHGPIPLNGLVFGFHPQVGETIEEAVIPRVVPGDPDEDKIRELWAQLEPYRILDVKKTSKIWKNEPLMKKLRDLGVVKQTQSLEFGAKKTKEDTDGQE